MPATNLLVTNPSPLTDEVIWFPTKDAFNNFISALYVNIGAVNLPTATTAAQGAVLKANTTVFTNAPATVTYLTIQNDAGADVNVPSQAAYDTLKTQLDTLVTSYVALRAALTAAGITVN